MALPLGVQLLGTTLHLEIAGPPGPWVCQAWAWLDLDPFECEAALTAGGLPGLVCREETCGVSLTSESGDQQPQVCLELPVGELLAAGQSGVGVRGSGSPGAQLGLRVDVVHSAFGRFVLKLPAATLASLDALARQRAE